MSKEQIQALKESHPDLFAAKLAAGLSAAEAAAAIQAQLDHDAANPPDAEAKRRAHSIADLYVAKARQLQALKLESIELFKAYPDADEDAELTAKLALTQDDTPEELPLRAECKQREADNLKLEHLVIDLEAELAELKPQLALKDERIGNLEAELAELQPHLTRIAALEAANVECNNMISDLNEQITRLKATKKK